MTLAINDNSPYFFIQKNIEDVNMISRMMGYMRPSFSRQESKFISRFITPTGAKPDSFGNYILRLGTAPIMWSCHTDTVHAISGFEMPDLDKVTGLLTVTNKPDVNCLGADCTAGVWLMLEMIKAKVEGLYIFHRAEEDGGLGSNFIVNQTPEVVKDIKYAIAFDRFGTSSIITYQMCDRCCSNDFAMSLSDVLASSGLKGYEIDEGGVYTDTAFYTKLIPECTNISVGYGNQHRKAEYQDLVHLIKLRDALISANFSKLVVSRDVNDVTDQYNWGKLFGPDRRHEMSLTEVVATYPEKVANIFRQKGFTAEDLLDFIDTFY